MSPASSDLEVLKIFRPGGSMRKNEKGFTLLETLVTAGIAGALAAATFPSVSSAMNSHRLMAGLRGTAGCIRAARSAAVMRNMQGQIVVSNDGTTLTVQVAPTGTTTWTSIGTPLVLEGGLTVSSVSPSNGLLFTSTGAASNNTGAVVTLSNARGDTRTIAVGALGRVDIS
jgi:prepilin-type N-terminal cleavage/methylation domain-containing protein